MQPPFREQPTMIKPPTKKHVLANHASGKLVLKVLAKLQLTTELYAAPARLQEK